MFYQQSIILTLIINEHWLYSMLIPIFSSGGGGGGVGAGAGGGGGIGGGGGKLLLYVTFRNKWSFK